jgi:hypothetical protein
MAKKTIKGTGTKYTGTAGADELTVIGKKTTVSGAKGNDTITVSKGSGHTIYGAAGKDKIYIKGSTASSKIYGDDAKDKVSGNDTITISGGEKNKIYGGKGNDTLILNGGSSNTIYGGKGNDVFVIGKDSTGEAVVKDFRTQSENFDKVKVSDDKVKNIEYSGSNVIIAGGKSGSLTLTGAKNRTVNITETNGEYSVTPTMGITMKLKKNYTGSYYASSFVNNIDASLVKSEISIYGNDKNNQITAARVDGGYYLGGAGDDIITATAGNKHCIYGEDGSGSGKGNDIITVTGGNGHTIYGQYGDDSITVKNGTGHFIKGDDGNDTISVTGGHSHKITGWDGNDLITLDYVKGSDNDYDSSTSSVVEAGSGDDTITVNNSRNVRIYGDHGSDTINVSNSNYVKVQSYDVKVRVESCQNTDVWCTDNCSSDVFVTGTGNKVLVDLKGGSKDNIEVDWRENFGYLEIHACSTSHEYYGDKYVDSLSINKSIANFDIRKSGDYDLTINGNDGGSILIKSFYSKDSDMSFIGGINFNGTNYSYEYIKDLAGYGK